jgi:hypothetical protein
MKTILTNVVALLICVALGIGGIVWVTRSDQTTWPDFSAQSVQNAQEPLAPNVVSQYERDFGWRIGDVIPIQLYLQQKPGTVVDLHSLAVEGDFEIVDNPAITTRDFKDGSRNISVKFKIQSMSNAKKLSLKVSMLYRQLSTGDDKLISIPAFEPFTSPTWDGRDVIQDGKPAYVQGDHLLWTLGNIFGGIAGCFAALYLRRKFIAAIELVKQKIWDTRRQIARREFDEAWARMEAGKITVGNYKAIARCVRKLFRIEAKVRREIELELGGAHPYRVQTLRILEITGKVLYEKRSLTRDEHYSIKTLFDEIVPPSVGHGEAADAASGSKP